MVQGRSPALEFPRASAKVLEGAGKLAALMRAGGLSAVFQPIASLKSGAVYAHEALIRGPLDNPLRSPDMLLKAAVSENLSFDFENHCVVAALRQWGKSQNPGRLFVNISAAVLEKVMRISGSDALTQLVSGLGVLPRILVLEITEHERVTDMDSLAQVVEIVRAAGLSLALDDFGDGRSSLRLWSQLKPEYVKIDKYFTRNISQYADKLKTIQALQQIATIFNTTLIAEGIETADDLRVLRDLGIPLGQGYFLGYPQALPQAAIPSEALTVTLDRRISVFPEHSKIVQQGHLRPLNVIEAPSVSVETSNDDVAAIFLAAPQLHALALTDSARPMGIINRSQFLNKYSQLYYREVWGKKSCMTHANLEPRLVELDHDIDELVGILTSDDQRYLADGFIVTENGRYIGLGTSDHLVRSVTEARIESARHANPLTFLPGNLPISQHITRLLDGAVEFVACYADLNDFKPFNDRYGYWRGDEMIRLVAKIILSHCDAQRDFVGHVGGDDFIMLLQSDDWRQRCEKIISELANGAKELFSHEDRERGGIEAEDRHGVVRFFPCTSLSIGVVPVKPGVFTLVEEVASKAALAKHQAKSAQSGLYVWMSAVSHLTPGLKEIVP